MTVIFEANGRDLPGCSAERRRGPGLTRLFAFNWIVACTIHKIMPRNRARFAAPSTRKVLFIFYLMFAATE